MLPVYPPHYAPDSGTARPAGRKDSAPETSLPRSLSAKRQARRAEAVGVRVAHRKRGAVSSVQAAAATLRAVISHLPQDVIGRLDSDLATVTDLLSETLATSCRQQEVIGEASNLRSGLTGSLYALLNLVERAVDTKAAQLASQNTPAETALPAEVSRKVQELRGKAPPKTADKDMNRYLREITSQGWAVEKTGGNHLKIWGPAGEGPYVFSSTPSGSTSNRKLRGLADQIRKSNGKDRNT